MPEENALVTEKDLNTLESVIAPSGSSELSNSEREELEQYRKWTQKASAVCQSAARGDLEARVLHIEVDGDLGTMLHSINSMLDYTDAFVRESKAALDHAAQGKFFRRVLLRGMAGTFKNASEMINSATDEMQNQANALIAAKEERIQIADDFHGTVKEITTVVASAATEMYATAKTLSQSAEHTVTESTAAQELSQQTVANVENVSNSTSNLSEAVSDINRKVIESTDVLKKAQSEAETANQKITELKKSSGNIDEVVRMISDIARQTNLLALNAAIEAARAGDAGKGFAVVASEVKELAQQTESATNRVSQEIRNIQSGTKDANSAIEKFNTTLGQMGTISAAISQSVEEQSSSTLEISKNVAEAADKTQTVTDKVEEVSTIAGDTKNSVDEMVTAADELSRQSETLSVAVDKFLVTIRG